LQTDQILNRYAAQIDMVPRSFAEPDRDIFCNIPQLISMGFSGDLDTGLQVVIGVLEPGQGNLRRYSVSRIALTFCL
jgi:hypothetical protein